MRETSSPTSQQMLAAWSLCCLLAALIFMAYAGASLATGRGEFILPLDDTYIHFQYARQIANGQPYIYNPGDPPTSGATSFLYPYLLAAGYALGFRGLDLGLWAVGIGALGLAFSTWLVYRLGRVYGVAQPLALLAALAFAVTGSISWHFMNGMETGLIITLTLLTLYMIARRDYRGFVIAAALLALSRPEGSIMAVIAVGFLGLRSWRTGQRSQLPWLGIPLLAVSVQPLLNLLLTGSLSASGSSAKSIFGTIPFHLDAALGRVFEQFSRMWLELATGTGGLHTPLIIPPLALVGLIFLLASRERRLPGLLLIVWLLAVTAAVSTLDTAFWHFKRYQMPLFALLYPLAVWGAQSLIDRTTHWLTLPRRRGVLPAAAGVMMLLAVLPGAVEFLRLYVVNVRNITAQPLPMARWLAQHTPADAVIAVHDVGMMRYLGERYTVDMVGLTTPGAADAWRNGPGAVAAFLYRHDPRPEYIAAYTTARGLNYLADTSIYGELLAGFTAEYRPEDNVALGAEFQGIYRADWAAMERAAVPLQPSTQRYVNGLDLIATINVADLISEGAANYAWNDTRREVGFSTEVYELGNAPDGNSPSILDAGRRITGDETFTLHVQPGQDAILITRLHPTTRGTYSVYAGDEFIARRWIPEMPGRWLEIPTLIPAERVTGERLTIRIAPEVGSGAYMPYHHWVFQGEYTPAAGDDPAAAFQDGTIILHRPEISVEDGRLTLSLQWETDGSATGDYKLFAHIYDDVASPPIAQADSYPGAGTLPPGNWLPGVISDTLVVDLTQIPPGRYRVALGLYEAHTLERLPLTALAAGVEADEDHRRLFVGSIDVGD